MIKQKARGRLGLNPIKRTLREKASCCRITATGGIYFEKEMDKHRKVYTHNNANAQRTMYKTTNR
jgi:hypothetical protein